ncbi:hypothetical protein QOZ80_5AG0372670 [Eleusine coracana subsp. coracana]|nr:hypothetical protein QOZ80_5AG0372670 [Eleusine coracana subsp. coracana]
MASSTPAADTDPPECPVCLCPFDAASAVPRVLPCGHSLCGVCIAALPPASASAAASLRCPLCSQCVPFSRALGPSSLPKNLALLALLPSAASSTSRGSAAAAAAPPPLPLPLRAAHSRLLSRFRHAVLPEVASPLRTAPAPNRLALGSLDSDLGAPWFCSRGRPVSLLPIGTKNGVRPLEHEDAFYRLSYTARVLAAVSSLNDAAWEELAGLITASSRLARWVCRVYGVWMGPEAAPLWMVSERHQSGVSLLLEEERIDGENRVSQIGAVAMEMCEAIMGLHGEGLVLGCLGLDCFSLDRFGHCFLDLNQVLALCQRVRSGASSSEIGAFVAPEVVAVLGDTSRMKDCDFDGLVGYHADVWSLGCLLVMLLTGDDKLVIGWSTDASYGDWEKKLVTRLDASLVGTELEPLSAITASCLSYDPKGRPEIADVWKCIRALLMKCSNTALDLDDVLPDEKSFQCLLLGKLSSMFVESCAANSDGKMQSSSGSDESRSNQDGPCNGGFPSNEANDCSGIDDPQSGEVFKSSTLLGHRDCVTGLAIGGGFLFSCSYDKTINVWSLKDLSHVQCLKGHKHKITAIIAVFTVWLSPQLVIFTLVVETSLSRLGHWRIIHFDAL